MMKKFILIGCVVFLTSCFGGASTAPSNNGDRSDNNIEECEKNDIYFCEYCGKMFHSVKDLSVNSCKRHPNGANEGCHKLYEGSLKRKYECVYCGKEAKSISDLTVNKCKYSPMGGNHKPRL